MITVAISDARANLPELVKKVDDALERVVITVQGKPKAVLMSADELESIEETAEILVIPGAKKDILEGLEQLEKGEGRVLEEVLKEL